MSYKEDILYRDHDIDETYLEYMAIEPLADGIEDIKTSQCMALLKRIQTQFCVGVKERLSIRPP